MRFPTRKQARSILARFDPDSFHPETDAFELMDTLYAKDFIISDFNWPDWEEGSTNGTDTSWIATLDFETLCKLFTAHARHDRFCENHWYVISRDGVMAAMLRRLSELTQ